MESPDDRYLDVEGKSLESLCALVSGLSARLRECDQLSSLRVGQEVQRIHTQWQRILGTEHEACLQLSVVLLEHFNEIETEEATEIAFSLVNDTRSTALAPGHVIACRTMVIVGELLAKTRNSEDAVAMLEGVIGLMESEAASGESTATEMYGSLPGNARMVLGKVEVERSNPEEALRLFLEALELNREVPPSDEQRKSLIHVLVATAHFGVETGNISNRKALEMLLESRAIAKQAIEWDPRMYIASSAEVADQYCISGQPMKALSMLEETVKFAEERFLPTHHAVLGAKVYWASFLSQWDYDDEAEVIFQELLPLVDGTKLLPTVLEGLAAIYIESGRSDEGEVLLNRRIEVVKQLFGEESDALVDALRAKAAFLAKNGDLTEAIGVINLALAMNEDIESGVPFHVFQLRELAAKIYLDSENFSDARAQAQSILDLHIEAVGRRHPRVAEALFLQARIEVREDPSMALELIRDALSIHEEYYEGAAHQDTAEMLEAAAELLVEDEAQLQEGIAMQVRAVEMYKCLMGEYSPDSITALTQLSSYYSEASELSKACETIARVIAHLEQEDKPLPLATAYATLSEVLPDDRMNEKVALVQKALAEMKKLNRSHEVTVSLNRMLADMIRPFHIEEAIFYQKAAVEASAALSGKESTETVDQMQALGELLLNSGDLDGAIQMMEATHTARQALEAPADDQAEALIVLTAALADNERFDEATRRHEELVSMVDDCQDPAVKAGILFGFGIFLIARQLQLDRAASLLEVAHSHAIECLYFDAALGIPVKLYEVFPDQAIRWMPLFEQAMDAAEEHMEALQEDAPDLLHPFTRALASIHAELQGRVTKGAF